MIIDINGHDIKFGFGLYFLGKAQKEQNTDLSGLLQSLVKNPIADMVDLMFFSAKCEADLDEVKLQITKREFLDFLESNNDFQKTDGYLAQWSTKLVDSVKIMFSENENVVENEAVKKN
jgi:hypothetical protein